MSCRMHHSCRHVVSLFYLLEYCHVTRTGTSQQLHGANSAPNRRLFNIIALNQRWFWVDSVPCGMLFKNVFSVLRQQISRYMNCSPCFVTMLIKTYLYVYVHGPVGLMLIKLFYYYWITYGYFIVDKQNIVLQVERQWISS